MAQVSTQRLRQLRDMTLRYLYENAATSIGFNMPMQEVATALGMSQEELQAVSVVFFNQGLSGGRGQTINGFNLSSYGQQEAERVGPAVLLRDPPSPAHVTIHANYSVVQVGGANSTQTATLSLDSAPIEATLRQIEEELRRLNIPEAAKAEAAGLIAAVREGDYALDKPNC